MGKQVTLTDRITGEIIYPVTTLNSVYNQYNTTLSDLLDQINTEIQDRYTKLDIDTLLKGQFTNLSNTSDNKISITVGGVSKTLEVAYAANAGTLGGYSLVAGTNRYGHIPVIGADGVIEIGKYIDFHSDSTTNTDYSTRIQSNGNNSNILTLPTSTGTLALTSDIPSLSNSVTLDSAQTISGVKTFSTQQKFTVADGTSPFTVNSNILISNLNADLLDGYHADTSSTGGAWAFIPTVKSDGVMDIGRYIDFHHVSNDGSDYKARLHTDGSTDGQLFINGNKIWNANNLTNLSQLTNDPGYITSSGSISGNAATATNSVSATKLTGPAHTDGTSGWFRSDGNTGWYNETYGGGIYMADSNYVRTFGNKSFSCNKTIHADNDITSDGSMSVGTNIYLGNHTTGNYGIYATMGNNDGWYIQGEAASSNVSGLRIGTWDDSAEYIAVSQGGSNTSFTRTAYLLDSSGNTSFPGSLTMGNDIYIKHAISADMTYKTANPKLVFSDNGIQPVGLVYTDADAYRPTKGLKVMDVDNNDTSNVWFEAQGEMYAARGNKVLHTGNSSVSGNTININGTSTTWTNNDGNADMVDGYHASAFATSGHSHGINTSDYTVTVDNTTTDSGWSMLGFSNSDFALKSIRTQAIAPGWLIGNYSAGIAFGGDDTKGVISVSYFESRIRVAGGNGTTPVWNVDLVHSGNITDQSVKHADNAGQVNNTLTFKNDGTGVTGSTTGNAFNGSDDITVSYNTIGAAKAVHSHIWSDITDRPSSLPANGGNAATLGGTSLSGLLTSFTNDGDNLSLTVGGTTKTVTPLYANYASHAGSATSAEYVDYSLYFSSAGDGVAPGNSDIYFDGSVDRTISYNSVGAAAASHTHSWSDITSGVPNLSLTTSGSGNAVSSISVSGHTITQNLTTYNNYSLPTAADTTLGGVKTGYTTSGQNYKVSIDTSGNLYTNVPWANTWNANSVNVAGYVSAPTSSNANKVWKTDANGNPGWRTDQDTTSFTLSMAVSSGTSSITLDFGTKYLLTAGGSTYIFTMPTNYQTGMYVGASQTASNSAVTNPYVNIYDSSIYRSKLQLVGAGGTTITSNDSSAITISSTSAGKLWIANSGITTKYISGLYINQVAHGTTGCFTEVNNANIILTVESESDGKYNKQLGFSSNGNLYYRSFVNADPDSTTAWKTIIDSGNIGSQAVTSASKLTTAVSIWGKTFDGSSNITGNLVSTGLSTDWTDTWSDGTNTHPWYGYDMNHPNTGIYSTTISDYFGMTLRTNATIFSLSESDGAILNSKLTLTAGYINVDSVKFRTNDTDTPLGLFGQDTANRAFNFQGPVNNGYLTFGRVGGVKVIQIDSNNNVYIGGVSNTDTAYVTNNSYKLKVNGTTRIESTLSVGSTITATAFYESSDERLKNSISNILKDDIKLSDKIKFKQYKFNNDPSKKHYGVIAQDLLDLGFNNLVKGDEKSYYSVDYISLLILKMQAMQNKIDELTKKINNL